MINCLQISLSISNCAATAWDKSHGKWKAQCKGKHRGLHATEEAAAQAAAQAYDTCSNAGPYLGRSPTYAKRRGGTSQFKGVTWVKTQGKWKAQCNGKYLGFHATEEVAAQAHDDYVKDGIVPAGHREPTSSQFKGVFWDKRVEKWKAACKGTYLGRHATEEAAAQAYEDYVKDGVALVQHRDHSTTSEYKGVFWDKRLGKWKAACKGTYLGNHATEEAAARAYEDFVKDNVDPVTRRDNTSTSQFKGVFWVKTHGRWTADFKGKNRGYHATEEAAARAYDSYVKDGVDPVKRRECNSSQFKGVSWDKSCGMWKAKCKGRYFGSHATEEAAARAYNTEAERIGLATVNVIPPAGDADDCPAALVLLSLAACAHTHAGAGSKRSKRAGASTTPAPPQRKKMRVDTAAGAASASGRGERRLGGGAGGGCAGAALVV